MSPPRPSAPRFFRYGDHADPVRYVGCDDLIDAVASILRGWEIREVAPGGHPVLRLRRTRRGYRRVSCWTDRPSLVREHTRTTLAEALCGWHYEFIDWHIEEHPELLFVHGAAARFGDRLVVFPALAKAGKSTLTVRLALQGRRVFCDDVLPIDPTTRCGIAMGIVPRLRPPLPANLRPEMRRFVDERRGHEFVNRLYVNLRPDELAPFGETTAVRAVVLLDRRSRGKAEIRAVDPAEGLERVILQNFAAGLPARRILATLADVVLGSACYTMRYVDLEDAASMLEETFGPEPAKRPPGGRDR